MIGDCRAVSLQSSHDSDCGAGHIGSQCQEFKLKPFLTGRPRLILLMPNRAYLKKKMYEAIIMVHEEDCCEFEYSLDCKR